MSDILEILVKATDLASGTLKKVDAEVEKLGKTAPATGSKWSQAMTSMKAAASSQMGQMLTLAGGVTAVGGAVVATAKFVQSSVNDWVAYNEEIRKLSIASGAGAEDLSRLVQAADDVGVSMDAMQTSMGLASKNGVIPTIGNIAALSDRLRGMTDITARNDEMNRIFGRGWKEIAPFILAGGDAIRDGTAAISDSMVVTEDSIEASRNYAAQLDTLNDSFTGVKNTIAQAALPALSAFLTELNQTEIIDNSIEKLSAFIKLMLIANPAFRESALAIGSDSAAMLGLSSTLEITNDRYDAMRAQVIAVNEAGLEQKVITDANVVAYLEAENALQTYNAMLMSTRNKAEGSQGALRKLEQSFLAAGYSAEEAAAMVAALRGQINGLHSKTVTITVRVNMPQGGVVVRGGQLDYQNFSPAEEIIYNKAYEDWIKAGSVGPAPTGSMTQGNSTPKTMTEKEKTQRAKNNRSKRTGSGGATGLDMIVPAGYPNDSYPIWTTSGERVTVETKEQQKRGGGDTYIMNVYTNAPVSTVVRDFQMMRAMGA